MSRRILLVSVWVLACVWTTGVPGSEMTRAEKEAFLKKAKIVRTKDIGAGISKPLKVYLEKDGIKLNAIYKNIDNVMKVDARHASETAKQHIDSYKCELAAYELDKLMDLDILPPIVVRKVNGEKGSLREWVEDILPRYGHGQNPPEGAQLGDWLHTVWMFDYLIYNIDRGTHNIMIATDWSPVVIDNSMSFNTFQKPIRPLYRFPRGPVAKLRTLEDKQLRKAMKKYLKSYQIKALWARIQNLIEIVDDRVATYGEDEVMYQLPRLSSR